MGEVCRLLTDDTERLAPKIVLTCGEYDRWTSKQLMAAHPEAQTLSSGMKTRIVRDCIARDESIQVLGPIGVDIYKDIASVTTEGLISMDRAIQVGYPVTVETANELFDRQERRIAANASNRG